MRITDELRKWMRKHHVLLDGLTDLTAIVDRIDEECERRQEEAIDEVLGGLMKMTDEKMAENGWVRLPVKGEAPSEQLAEWIEGRGLVNGPLDADGEPWHRGDMSDTNWGVIEGISFSAGEWWICGHDVTAPWITANSARHYHKPTVEDVLREMMRDAACQFHDDGSCEMGLTYEQFDKYAQRLRLRESTDD